MPRDRVPNSHAAADVGGRPAARAPGWKPLLVSALVHAGAGLLLFRAAAGNRREESPHPAVMPGAVEIMLFAPAQSPDANPNPAQSTSVSSNRLPRSRSRARASVSPSKAAAIPAPSSVVTPAPDETAVAPTVSGLAMRPPYLSFDGLPVERKARIATPPNPEEDLERLLVPPPQSNGRWRAFAEVRAEGERQEDAVSNVRLGRAHPLHFDYLRDARHLLAAEAERLGEQFPLGVAETVAGWGRGYVDRIAELRSGTEADRTARPPELASNGHSDVLDGYDEARRQAENGAVTRATYVCLGIAPLHTVVVTLGRSSGNDQLDRLAIDSFQSAVTRRPVPSDIRPGLACYAVRVGAYRQPPLPSLSLGWKNGRPTLTYPLQKLTKVTVELASVDYGQRSGPASLLRRPH